MGRDTKMSLGANMEITHCNITTKLPTCERLSWKYNVKTMKRYPLGRFVNLQKLQSTKENRKKEAK